MKTVIIIGILLGIDQFSKYLVTVNLSGKEPLEIIPGYLEFFYLENRGAAFGMLQEKRFLFILITIAVLGFILYTFLHYDMSNRLLYWSLILIMAGTLGNFIDRLRLHYVVDFVKTRIFGYNFAIFNFADVFIVVGTFMLMLYILLSDGKGKIT